MRINAESDVPAPARAPTPRNCTHKWAPKQGEIDGFGIAHIFPGEGTSTLASSPMTNHKQPLRNRPINHTQTPRNHEQKGGCLGTYQGLRQRTAPQRHACCSPRPRSTRRSQPGPASPLELQATNLRNESAIADFIDRLWSYASHRSSGRTRGCPPSAP